MSTHHHASAKLNCNTTTAHLKFIELVKRYPILYKGNELILDSQDFRRNQKTINQSWHLIASELGVSVGECKRRWKFLKETFLQIRKRSQSDAGNQNRKKWVYEDALSFLTNSKIDNPQELQPTMDNIIRIESGSSNIEEGTVEFIELDMNTMGDSEYYIMDSSMDEETGEMIKIATPLQPNQIIVNDKTVQKIITICDDSQNLENATFVDVNDLDKNNYIIASSAESEEDVKYVFTNGTDEAAEKIEMENGNEDEEQSEFYENADKIETKTMCLSEEQIERINELLAMPGNEIDAEHFFENMAKMVLRLPTKLQAEVKSQISSIVSSAEMSFLKKVK